MCAGFAKTGSSFLDTTQSQYFRRRDSATGAFLLVGIIQFSFMMKLPNNVEFEGKTLPRMYVARRRLMI